MVTAPFTIRYTSRSSRTTSSMSTPATRGTAPVGIAERERAYDKAVAEAIRKDCQFDAGAGRNGSVQRRSGRRPRGGS